MPVLLSIAELLSSLAPTIAQLIENETGGSYDPEVERQALLNASRALEDARVAKALATKKGS